MEQPRDSATWTTFVLGYAVLPYTNFVREAFDIDRKNYWFLFAFTGVLFFSAFLFNSPAEIFYGSFVILKSPANLITDYFEIATVGAALMNAALMALKSLLILRMSRVSLNGSYIAAILTVAGFSLFGKNLYNSLPIIFGVFLYTRLKGCKFEKCLLPALFGTALGPLVSEISFNLDIPLSLSIPMGVMAGNITGLILPPMAEHFKSFHKGYNLYNIGFTAGIIGTFFIAVLRSFNVEVKTVHIVSSGNNISMILLLGFVFVLLLFWGFVKNGWSFKGYIKFLNYRDLDKKDCFLSWGAGITYINMALLGLITTSYVLLVGGELNGPVIGGILTVAGFGAYGKNPRNVIPIILGVFLAGHFSFHDLNSTTILLAALFGTTLAPVTQVFGAIPGILAGAIHVSLVVNISYMHAGMNLYNNGFSGGFIAAALVPLMEAVTSHGKHEPVLGNRQQESK